MRTLGQFLGLFLPGGALACVIRRSRAGLSDPNRPAFQALLFSKIVPNVKRLGLLNDRLRGQFGKLGILGFEDLEPSA